MGCWTPSLSRGTRSTKPKGTGAQLSDHHQGSRTGHVAGEGDLSQLGHSLYRQAGLCAAASCRVAGEDHGTGSTPAGRVLLPTTRCAANGTSGSAAGAVGGGQETPGLETALPDSFDRSDPGSRTAWHSADSAPFPHQAAAMDVQRIWHRDTKQRRSP